MYPLARSLALANGGTCDVCKCVLRLDVFTIRDGGSGIGRRGPSEEDVTVLRVSVTTG